MTDAAVPLPELHCPLCGGPNGCVPAACGSFEVNCWCKSVAFSAELLARVPEAARHKACICRGCATGATFDTPGQQPGA